MSVRWLMFLSAIWVVGTLICSIGEGIFEGQPVKDQINDITGYQYLESQGLVGIPLMGATFFSNLPKFLAFDYAFFEGSDGFLILRFVFMAISVGVVFGIIQIFLPAMQQLATSFFRLFR